LIAPNNRVDSEYLDILERADILINYAINHNIALCTFTLGENVVNVYYMTISN